VRDHALSVACVRQGLTAVQARGYDHLPAEALARFAVTHVGALTSHALRAALAAAVSALMREGAEAGLPTADVVAERVGRSARERRRAVASSAGFWQPPSARLRLTPGGTISWMRSSTSFG
jgi:hypothetical protein